MVAQERMFKNDTWQKVMTWRLFYYQCIGKEGNIHREEEKSEADGLTGESSGPSSLRSNPGGGGGAPLTEEEAETLSQMKTEKLKDDGNSGWALSSPSGMMRPRSPSPLSSHGGPAPRETMKTTIIITIIIIIRARMDPIAQERKTYPRIS
ncbi:Uncharacterized protein FKW44_021007 [Caligus rogercresseyi]|uniref:Uncharacterized protein n=1 Tax=Caligus rogercresseyi TaxID=217165 RepID=A0A7T8GQS4_CALRO|nr:Uncharacterized protein FKW44_021007 [Caligus rogercresseyi]